MDERIERRRRRGRLRAGLRLLLKALAAANTKDANRADAVSRERVLKLFADPVAARSHADVLNDCAEAIAGALAAPGTAERPRVMRAYGTSLRTLQAGASLSRADRLMALLARVPLAKAPGDAPNVVPRALQTRSALRP